MPHSIERSIEAAEVSLRMEGLSVTETCKELCRKLLAGEITLEQDRNSTRLNSSHWS